MAPRIVSTKMTGQKHKDAGNVSRQHDASVKAIEAMTGFRFTLAENDYIVVTKGPGESHLLKLGPRENV